MAYSLPVSAIVDAAKTGGIGLNLRAAPQSSGARLRTMTDGTRLDVVGVAREAFNPDSARLWYQVRVQAQVGYCFGDFLRLDSAPEPLPPNAGVDPIKTNGIGLNLRASPDRTAARVTTMPDRSPLRIIGAARENFTSGAAMWYQVVFGPQQGYCLSDFLSIAGLPGSGLITAPFVGVWPVIFPERVVTARFNQPRPRFNATIKAHEGIDLRTGANNPPVVAWADGVVDKTFTWDRAVWEQTRDSQQAYGNYVRLNHPQLGLQSMYCHLTDNSFSVAAGQAVRAGDQLALGDNTGNSDGAHLHFMLIDRVNGLDGYVYPKVIDPTPHLPKPFFIKPDPQG